MGPFFLGSWVLSLVDIPESFFARTIIWAFGIDAPVLIVLFGTLMLKMLFVMLMLLLPTMFIGWLPPTITNEGSCAVCCIPCADVAAVMVDAGDDRDWLTEDMTWVGVLHVWLRTLPVWAGIFFVRVVTLSTDPISSEVSLPLRVDISKELPNFSDKCLAMISRLFITVEWPRLSLSTLFFLLGIRRIWHLPRSKIRQEICYNNNNNNYNNK